MEAEAQPSRRPEDTPFKQQRLKAWQPILTPPRVVALFLAIGVIFLPIGGVLLQESNDVVQERVKYDGSGRDVDCRITEENEGRVCTLNVTISEKMDGPVWVYYELGPYYQNHRRYVASLSTDQLLGDRLESSELDSCEPVKKNGSQLLNPCGLIANTLFNDVYELLNDDIELKEDGIAWDSDDEKFQQVDGFEKKRVDDASLTREEACDLIGTASKYDDCQLYTDDDGQLWVFWYPKDSEVQYLYETYPMVVSPLEGVENEHFQVHMRTAGLPNFRKPYGRITEDIPKGTVLSFRVQANFLVKDFDGSKTLVVTTTSTYGGKNPFLGAAYLTVGSISVALAIAFATKQAVAGRRLGDLRAV